MPKVKSKTKNQKSKMVKQKQVSKTKEKKTMVVTSSSRQVLRGRVVSTKLPKTVTVLIERRKTHPLYGKSFKRSKKYLVHDPIGVLEGDVVDIVPTKPISKHKHFIVLKVIGKDIEAIVAQKLKEEAAQVIAQVMPEEKEEDGSA